ncbi:peptidase S8 [Bacillus sp. HMF5848]|uniref:S8 family peptidase n=1 Tax=Bacillus sp. HMF5848 TaxID=2495421 RepID=UPI000F7B9A4E|nr:S8 family serine peptidase [Bacillus sp. HMF5848]RSK28681.1 peptidase S8 [Bacillus sp. HMF5848]
MKKWQKTAATLTLATTLLVPSFATAATTADTQMQYGKRSYDLLERLNMTPQQQSKLKYEQKSEKESVFSEDTIIVKYSSNKLSFTDHKRLGGYVIKSIPKLGYDVVKIQRGQKIDDVIKRYYSTGDVVYAAPSQKPQLYTTEFNDPKVSEQYFVDLLNIAEAQKLAGNNEVIVGVLDTPMDVNHPELKGKVLPPYNPYNPADPGDLYHFHATHVAGLVAAEANNNQGGIGVAPNVKIMPVAALDAYGGGSEYGVADAILYAVENGVDVINMSLGFPWYTPLIEEAVKVAVDAGVVVVASAGNSYDTHYNYPAALPGVITVGATNDQNKKAEFSTYGPQIDVVAPGEEVYSSVYAPGVGQSYADASGTSMSGPIVAGVAALIKSNYPDLNTYQIEQILEETATDLGDEGFDQEFGYGLVNPVAALNYDMSKLTEKPEMVASVDTAFAIQEREPGVYTRKGFIQTRFEEDWVKLPVVAGEQVQAILQSSENYDHMMELRFYPEGATESQEPIVVSKQREGEAESTLFTAEENGTLLVGVKDRNENFAPGAASMYELALIKSTEIPADESTKEAPLPLGALPVDSDDFYLALSEEQIEAQKEEMKQLQEQLKEEDMYYYDPMSNVIADKDYFTFSVDVPTKMKLNVSGVPGINITLKLYDEMMFNQPMPEGMPAWEKRYWPWAMQETNMNGDGEGETLAFEAYPGMTYVLEVAGNGFSYDDFWYYRPLPVSSGDDEFEVKSSFIPYNVTAEAVEMPADEDNYPMMDYPMYDEEMVKEIEAKEVGAAKATDDVIIIGESRSYWSSIGSEQVDQITQSALDFPLSTVQSGYFQTQWDEDWYNVSVEDTAIYEFSAPMTESLRPAIFLYEYDAEKNEMYMVGDPWMSYYYYPMEQTDVTIRTILEKDKQYFLQVRNDYYWSFDEYSVSFKKILDAPVDKNENNNEFIRATIMEPGKTLRGNFAQNNDLDIYYYKHTDPKAALGFLAETVELTDAQKDEIPEELRQPLDFIVSIVEDTDGNLQLSEDEILKSMQYYSRNWGQDAKFSGAFNAKKDVGYFFIVESWSWGSINVKEYEMSLFNYEGSDEDKDGRALALTADGAGKWKATGKLNGFVDFGDRDTYELNVAEKGLVTMELELPSGLDGVITVYDSAKNVIATFNTYLQDDNEYASLELEKGKYFVEVSDAMKRSHTDNYTLHVEWKK